MLSRCQWCGALGLNQDDDGIVETNPRQLYPSKLAHNLISLLPVVVTIFEGEKQVSFNLMLGEQFTWGKIWDPFKKQMG